MTVTPDPSPDLVRAAASPWRRRFNDWMVVALVTLAAGGLRLAAARDQFWVDEIASWRFARLMPSAVGVLHGIHSDNNHHLNTLWMYLAGDRRGWIVYRLPPVVLGTASVWLAAVLARRRPRRGGGDAGAVVAAVLVGFSSMLVHYGSEARGYGYAIFFSLLALLLLRRAIDRPSTGARVAFGACCGLALLSHLSFLYVYAGLAAWSAMELRRDGRGRTAIRLIQLHGPYLAIFLVMYAIDLSRMEVAGGPVFPIFDVIGDAAAATVGGPRLLAVAVVGVTLEAALVWLAWRRRTEWVLFAVACVAAPALLLLTTRHPYVYPRYFALAVPFYFVLVASVAGGLWRRGRPWRVAIALLLALFLAGSVANYHRYFAGGRRGQYLDALRYVQASSDGRPTTVGSTRDGRNQMVVEFYQRYLDRPDALRYVAKPEWFEPSAAAADRPEWVIIDSPGEQPEMKAEWEQAMKGYQFDRGFPHSGLSGVSWFVYRRASPDR